MLGLAIDPQFPARPYVCPVHLRPHPRVQQPAPAVGGWLSQPARRHRPGLRRQWPAVAADRRRDRQADGRRQRACARRGLVPAVPQPFRRGPGLRPRRRAVCERRGWRQLQLRRPRPDQQSLRRPHGWRRCQRRPGWRPALPGPAHRRRSGDHGRNGHPDRREHARQSAQRHARADQQRQPDHRHRDAQPVPHHHRPGTSELWLGDVGWGTWEEINRIRPGGAIENFGWPCYEGNEQQPGYRDANLAICNNLAASQVTTVLSVAARRPAGWNWLRRHGVGGRRVGLLRPGRQLPGQLRQRPVLRRLHPRLHRGGPGGIRRPAHPAQAQVFATDAFGVVELEIGPDKNLWWVDLGGFVHRITYTGGNQAPVARISANPTSGPVPLAVNFDGRGSTDPDAGDDRVLLLGPRRRRHLRRRHRRPPTPTPRPAPSPGCG